MRIKRKNGLKIAAIAIALLLCLALAVGITGAWYQAKRQATGTLSMNQGIIIDYKGFNGSETGETWERGTTFELFSTKAGEVQPGAHIKVNPAGIKANAKSVNFYARVRLEYKFYNGEAEVTLEDPTVLIKTSNLFGLNWEFSSMAAPKDYYYYVENGTTTFKTMQAGADFVELIQGNAEFIIEGEGFVGADNNGASGGFVVDETTSINKIVVNLVLETLQGEADPATEGWKLTGSSDDPTEVIEDFISNDLRNSSGTILDSTSTDLIENTTYQVVDEEGNGYKFKYTLNEESKTATITGYVGSPTTLNIPKIIQVKQQDYTVAVIGDTAFYKCPNLTSITIPNSVTSIEDDAFGYCGGLTSITIGKGVTSIGNCAFYCCKELTSIIIPDNVASIGRGAFWFCRELTSITISDSVTSIGENAFVGCYALAEVYNLSPLSIIAGNGSDGDLGHYAKVIHTNADEPTRIVQENGIAYYVDGDTKIALILLDKTSTFSTIANDCTEINKYAFDNCTNLTSITIPDSVTSIGYGAFYGSAGLTGITIPDSVISVGEDAFRNCVGLTEITIQNGVTSIGRQAFASCTSITSIIIPDSVTSIGEYAFYGCTKLTNTIGDGWVKESGNTAVGASTLLRDIIYNIKRA